MRTTRSARLLAIAGAALAALLCGPVEEGMAALAFGPAQPISLGAGSFLAGNAGVAAGDIDQDGDLDLVVASCGSECGGTGGGGIAVLRNTGAATFTPPQGLLSGGNTRHVALADVNKDGDLDLLSGEKDSLNVRLGLASFQFSSPTSYPTGPGTYSSMAVGDVDKDTDLDVVTAHRGGPDNIQLRLNNGAGVLSAPTNFSSGTTATPVPYAVLLTDVNSDNLLDIVVANSAEGTITYRKQAGGTTFPTTQQFGVGGEPVSLASGAIRSSFFPDLAVANRTNSAGALYATLNTDPNVFDPIRTYPTGSPTLAVAGASLQDLTGETDVVSRQQDGTYDVFANTLSGGPNPLTHSLTLTGIAQPADADSEVIAADVTGDGALDLIGTNYGVGAVTLFRALPLVSAAGIDFDDQAVGSRSVTRTVTVGNSAPAPLDIASDAVTGADAGDFVKVADGCAGLTLNRGETCAISLRFKPSALGARTAALSLTDNAAGGGQSLALSGEGVAPAESVTGPAGPTGASGANGGGGSNGANGQNGASGPQGDQGPKGVDGAQGPKGDTGATGPRGPAGRDARVTCKPGKKKKGRVRVTCTVRFVSTGTARARLSRHGVVYAHGSGRIRRHAASLDLRTVRRTPPGEYTMRVRFGGGRLVREVVTVH